MNVTPLIVAFGSTDLYLIDAIMKGHFENSGSVLDAGCGEGRNIKYFLSNKFTVSGIDQNPSAIRMCRMQARSLQNDSGRYDFQEGDVRNLPYQDGSFDIVISSAVLHFAKDSADFQKMFSELVRVLAQNGILFIRMASDYGLQHPNSQNNFTFLLSEEIIDNILDKFGLEKIEPVKTVLVEDKRAMTTLLLRNKL